MPTIAELQEQKARLELEHDVASLQAEVKAADLAGRAVFREGWGDPVDTTEYLRDGTGASYFGGLTGGGHVSQPQDRWRGDNAPIWRTQAEHARIRGTARIIASLDEVGIAVLENLTNYIIGAGFGYEATVHPRVEDTQQNRALAMVANDVIERFVEQASWWGDGEREAFSSSRRDGETYLVLSHANREPIPRLRIVDPSFVVEPDSPRRLEDHLRLTRGNSDTFDWKYGHAAPWRESGKSEWIFISWYGDAMEWEAVPASRFVHLKLNVDRDVKRGLSDYYPVHETLRNADKLLTNMTQGAAVQAAIAYIREHAEGVTADGVKQFRGKLATDSRSRTVPTGATHTRYGREIRAGTVVDVVKGAKYHTGPLGTPRGMNYIAIIQAALRIVGIRWQMPEYMISGDASNNAFASSLVSEAPFTKSAEAKQTYYRRKYVELLWKMLSLAHLSGSFPAPPRHAQRLLSIEATGPAIAVRDRDTDHKIRREENEAGVLSRKTWTAEANRDYDEERQRIEEEQGAGTGGPAVPASTGE